MPRKRRGRTLTATPYLAVSLLLCALALAGEVAWLIFRPGDGCAPELLANDQKLNFQAAKITLQASVSKTAQEVLSENLRFYTNRSAELCRAVQRGRLSKADFAKQEEEAAQWYMVVSQAAARGRFATVAPEDRATFQAVVKQMGAPSTQVKTFGHVDLVTPDHLIIPNGATVHRGDRFAIEIDLRSKTYLYIVQTGSSGTTTRVFPSRRSDPRDNPVEGKLRIPQNVQQFFRFGPPPGAEHVFFFVGSRPDPEIERLPELGSPESAKKVQAIARFRDIFAPEPVAPQAPTAHELPQELKSHFDNAVLNLELNNAG